ncbi:oxidoreductase [Streptomyces sp. NPDC005538]|uniref:oxidoreductase n=1 Tax=unclassified Streptomyces TaxID=2593676 RepID=UPI0033A0B0BF
MSDSTEMPADLTPDERGMWMAFRMGSVYDGRPDSRGGDHPPSARLRVRAEIVAWLLLDGPPPLPGRVSSLKLRGLEITGVLDLSGAEVAAYVELVECDFTGPVELTASRMSTLRLVGCFLPTMHAEGVRVAGDLHLPRCTFHRGLVLKNAQVGGDLLLNQATLNPDRNGFSLLADGVVVTQNIEAEGLESDGRISLADAHVGKSCSFRGSRLRNRHDRYALTAPRLSVDRSLYFSPSAVARTDSEGGSGERRTVFDGEVQLDDARIGDAIDLQSAELRREEGVFSLRRVHASELRFLPREVHGSRVVLEEASVDTLVDSVSGWPRTGLELSGFVYKRIAPLGLFTVAERIAWLRTATLDTYDPQPYEQLARVLRAGGEPQDADTVLLARMRRRRETLGGVAKVWDAVQDVTFGYGYRPGRAVVWLSVIWAAGSLWFSHRPPAPMKAGEGPAWSPEIYTLDLLLPILDLGQETQWHTQGISMWIAVVLAFAGWILATSVAVGAAAVLLRRN